MMVAAKDDERRNVKVEPAVYDRLRARGKLGQTYSAVIKDLLDKVDVCDCDCAICEQCMSRPVLVPDKKGATKAKGRPK